MTEENTVQDAQDTRAIEIISTAICLASMENWPIFTAALLGEKETFQAHCLSANSITAWVKAKETDQDPNLTLEAFERLWNLTQTTLQQVMALTRTKLTRSESPILLYKSQQFQNERKMGLWIGPTTLQGGPPPSPTQFRMQRLTTECWENYHFYNADFNEMATHLKLSQTLL